MPAICQVHFQNMRIKGGTKETKSVLTLINHASQFGETKINMVSRIHRFQMGIGAKEKCKRVFGGIAIF